MSITPLPERGKLILDRDTANRYADLGVDRLIVYAARARDEKSLLEAVSDAEKNLIAK